MIIGAGGVGRVALHKCAQHPKIFQEIIFASRTVSKCDKIVADVKDYPYKIITEQVDADVVDEVEKLFNKYRPSFVINVALPYQNLPIMEACLRCNVNYLDTAIYEHPAVPKYFYAPQWEFHQRFKDAGLLAVLGCGFDPGVTNMYVAYAKKRLFDRIKTIDIIDCNAGDHGYPFATNFNPEINIREVTANGRYYDHGEWIETKPMEFKRVFNFPEGIGDRNMYLLYHEEMESLIKNYPEIERMRFWMTFGDSYLYHLKALENVGMTSVKPIMYQGREIVPLQFLREVLPDPASLGSRTVGKTCIGIWFVGEKDGKPKTCYLYNVCDHQESYNEVGSHSSSQVNGAAQASSTSRNLIPIRSWTKLATGACPGKTQRRRPFSINVSREIVLSLKLSARL